MTQRAKIASDQDGALLDHFDQLRQSSSGVSIDEELVNMTQAERSYQAVAKVITTTNDMLDTLMQIV